MWYWIGYSVVIGVAFLVFRVVVRKDYWNGRLSVISIALEFLVFALHANLPYLYLGLNWPEMPPLPENIPLKYLGIILIAVGVLLTVIIMSYLGLNATLGGKPRKLRQTGPYHIVRNPQVLAYGLALVGFAILYPSLQSAAWILLYGIIAHLMVLTEEEHLMRIFKLVYQDYCRRVPRYFPFPGLKGILPGQKKE